MNETIWDGGSTTWDGATTFWDVLPSIIGKTVEIVWTFATGVTWKQLDTGVKWR